MLPLSVLDYGGWRYAALDNMTWLAITVLAISVHLGVYWRVLRNWTVIRSERAIFFYHLWFSICLAVLAMSLAVISAISLADALGAIAVLGIYNVSFLELWSLSQGSYSLAILQHATKYGKVTLVDVPTFAATGTAKYEARLESIRALGLTTLHDGQVRLTKAGRAVAALLAVFVFLSNAERTG